MDKTIKQVLLMIEAAGFEAYIVGGYVRDFILKIKSTDIDICTNATPKDLTAIFEEYNYKSDDYGSFKIISDKYNVDITTYRKESKYENRKPTEVEYINNLITDLNRRDLTINAICMNSKEVIIDLLNGIVDIETKTIRVIGDANTKLKEDPLRILRAIRFASSLDFKIEDSLASAINNNKNLVANLSNTRKKEELEKILTTKKSLDGLTMLKKYGIDKYLDISYNNIIYSKDLCGMYSQIEVSDNYQFTKEEKKNITLIKEILSFGKINSKILFEYGLYLSTVAGEILGMDRKDIAMMFQSLPITSVNEINITASDIINTLKISPSKTIKIIFDEIKEKILDGTINNEKEDLTEYINDNKGKWDNA